MPTALITFTPLHPEQLFPLSYNCVRTHSGTTKKWWNTDTKEPTTTLSLVPQLCSNSVSPRETVVSSLWHGLALSGSSFSTGIPAWPLYTSALFSPSLHPAFSRMERLDMRKGAAEKLFLLFCRVWVKVQHVFTTVSSKACAARMHCVTLSPPQGQQTKHSISWACAHQWAQPGNRHQGQTTLPMPPSWDLCQWLPGKKNYIEPQEGAQNNQMCCCMHSEKSKLKYPATTPSSPLQDEKLGNVKTGSREALSAPHKKGTSWTKALWKKNNWS